MRAPLRPLASLVLATAAFALPATPHGGTFSGPGSSTGSGGPAPGSNPTAPADTAPSSGGGGATTGGGGSAPVTSGGTRPVTPPPSSSAPKSAGAKPSADLTHWGFWWHFNKEPLLDLRARLARSSTATGTDGFGRPSDEVIRERVLPVLFGAASDETYDGLMSGGVIALGRIQSPLSDKIAAALHESFGSSSGEVRESAALALGLLGDHAAMQHLAEILTGEAAKNKRWGHLLTDRMRAFAAYGLGYLASRSPIQDAKRMAVLHLIDRLTDDDENADIRIACLNAIGMADLTWDDGMHLGALNSPTRSRTGLVEYLLGLYLEGDAQLLEGHLPVAIGRLLHGAPVAFAERVTGQLLDSWSPTINHTNAVALMLAFGESDLPEDSEVLARVRAHLTVTALKGRIAIARRLALIDLAKLASRPTATGKPDKQACATFEAFLMRFRDAGHRTDRPWIGLAAANYNAQLLRYGANPSPALLSMLRELIEKGGSQDTASTCAIAVGLSEDLASGPFLLERLRGASSASERGFLCLAIGLVGYAEAKPDLEATLDAVRFSPPDLENTAIGLALLDRSGASVRLRKMLRETTLTSIAGSVAGALGRITDAAAVPEMARMYRAVGTSNLTRTYLAVSLGLACEQGRLPWFAQLSSGVNYLAWSPTLYDTAGKGILNLF
ncbi:MAG: HEAT repeat domain-containing protein [Planctomycetota bacterium]|nr:HEAT repeat domain-containing protein [Planctomycetota bacterium]